MCRGSAVSSRWAKLGGGCGRGSEGEAYSNGLAMLEKNNLSLSNMEMDLKHMDSIPLKINIIFKGKEKYSVSHDV